MRFKQRQSAKLPEVNLIPMLNLMMGILAFFVLITMTLSNEKLWRVQLPSQQADTAVADVPLPDPFIVELDAQGQILLNGQITNRAQLSGQMESYLAENSENTVFILPNRQLPYEQVIQFLGEIRDIGGDRVSLAISDTQDNRDN